MTPRQSDNPNHQPGHGPSIAATSLWGASDGKRQHLLTDEERARLSVISSVVRFKKGVSLYHEGDRADAVFNLVSGVVKSYRVAPDETRHIAAFLFPEDLIGLAEDGRYVNSAEAVTAVTGYRIPVTILRARLDRDPSLDFHVICKLCHELREAQRHAFLLSQHRALTKLAMFLELLEGYQAARGEGTAEVYLPMTQSDIADYIGTSAEAVSRSLKVLVKRRVIALRDRHHAKILDRSQLESIASTTGERRPLRQQIGGDRSENC